MGLNDLFAKAVFIEGETSDGRQLKSPFLVKKVSESTITLTAVRGNEVVVDKSDFENKSLKITVLEEN